MSESSSHSVNGTSPVYEGRSRDPSFSRSRSRSGDRHKEYKQSSRRSRSPHYREDKGHRGGHYREDHSERYSTSKRRYSHSPSYSRSKRYKSPMSNRRRHMGSREDPDPSNCIGVFGLSLNTSERQLQHVFGKYGPIDKIQVILDAKTGRSRGFAFIYFEMVEDATEAKNQCTGMDLDGRRIRVDFSITERAHTPTPGIYMGRPTYSDYGRRSYGGGGGSSRYGGGGEGYSGRRRSPSPHYRGPSRRSYRSRSRSNSPRRYSRY